MSQERKSHLRIKAEQGNPTDIVKWVTNSRSAYYSGLHLAKNFGEEVVGTYVAKYREAMNKKAEREPSTPENLGIGLRGIEPFSDITQTLISGTDHLHRQELQYVVFELFGKTK